LVADFDDFRDAFMTQSEAGREGGPAMDDGLIQIAGRRRNRPYDGVLAAPQDDFRIVPPAESALLLKI
jgi:hypothetical protein